MPASYASLESTPKQGLLFPGVFLTIATGIIVAGLVQQDWSQLNCADAMTVDLSTVTKDTSWCSNPTGGKYDSTLWGWITAFVISAEFFAMAVAAPGAGDVRIAFTIGYLVLGLSWLQDGISHLRFFENGGTDASSKVQDFLAFSAQLCGPAGEFIVFFSMLLVGGRNSCMGVLAESVVSVGGLGVVMYLAYSGRILTQMSKIYDISLVSGISLQVIASGVMLLGKSAALVPWAFVYFGTSAGAFLVYFLQPQPFASNQDFNDSSLFHATYMFSATTLFMLCGKLNGAFNVAEDSLDGAREAALTTQMAPEEAEAPKSMWCACCTGRSGGTMVSNMRP